MDPSAPDKIKQLIPKYVKSCGTCPGIIEQYDWNGQTVYGRGNTGLACDSRIQLYDLKGDKIAFDSASYVAFNKEAKYVKTIWKCKE